MHFFVMILLPIWGFCFLFQGVRSGNLALRQPVFQKSTYNSDSLVANSVDGSSSGNWPSRVCASTNWNTDPWWRVDLGRSYLVDEVRILNRADCCAERLHNFEIRVGDSLENDGNSNPKCGDLHSMASVAKKSFYCLPAMKGRYVNIRIPGASNILTLCEVIVNPNPAENIALQKSSSQSSRASSGYSQRALDGNSDGSYGRGTCTHTGSQKYPWWRVNLGSSMPVSEVFLVNRADSNINRLYDVEVRVGDSLDSNGNTNPRCGPVFSMATLYKKSIYCKPRKTGRHVNVRLVSGINQILTLCELSVYSESKAFLRDKPVQPTTVPFYVKSAIKLTCPEVFGFPVPHVAWLYEGSVLQNSTTQSSLQLNASLVQQNHTIECVVTNKHGADFHQFLMQPSLSHLSMCGRFGDLGDDTRRVRYSASNPSHAVNDSSIDENQWIRFVDPAHGSPLQLPENCIASYSCGTQAPGWLVGPHPTREENVAERSVCFSWAGNCCAFQTNVLVRRCYSHYVYQLKATRFPVKARYCTVPPPFSVPSVMFTGWQGEGHVLESHVIHVESSVVGASDCTIYCLVERKCASFNYFPAETRCELNNATRLQAPQSFKPKPGSEYHERAHAQLVGGTGIHVITLE